MQLQVDPWIMLLLVASGDIEVNPGPSDRNDITLCNVNIRSLNAKARGNYNISRFTAFTNALAGHFDIITATETWLTPEHPSADYIIPGYTGPYRLDRPDGSGHGGVAAWVANTLSVKRMTQLEEHDHETMWLMVNNKEKQVLIAVSYRQQRGTYAPTYWDKLQTGLDKAVASKIPNIILVGDFNADPGNKTEFDKLADFLSINNLFQHIREPTRVTQENSSILDLIITNLPSLVSRAGVQGPVHENDHNTIYGTINMRIVRRQTFVREMWDFKNANFDLFREELGNVDWEECLNLDDIDDVCEKWTTTFMNIAERVITKKKVKVRPHDKCWYNNYLRRLRRVKDRDHKIWVTIRQPINWDVYAASRNKYFQECDRIKLAYEEHIYATLADQINTNPKKWWSLVSQTMGKAKKSSFPVMENKGVLYSTDKEKAELFNQVYLESSNLSGDHFDLPEVVPAVDHETLEEIVVLEKDVEDVLKCLDTNKAYGPDNVSPRLVKEAGPAIVGILTKIFNKSLLLAKFPFIWKRANVLPIFKKAEEFIATNYRPVSLLSVLSKIFEKIVFKYLFNYFRSHFLISVWQSGFLPGSSTITQLTEIYDQFCKAVNDGKEIRVVFLDISKAFDRVWHKGLLYKLRSCGIAGRLLDWLEDYLTDRQQRVIINGETSEWGRINAGVPQGSVLGPLLFLIFINDLAYVIRNCSIRLFADDTCLYLEIDDPDLQAEAINDDLERINEWADKWHVQFSPPKTEELIISRKRNLVDHPNLTMDGQIITRVTNHKHLGLAIADDLSWNKHIDDIIAKANQRLGILRSLKFKLDRLSLERIYLSLIRPILEYGDIVWHSDSDVLDRLESVQRNAARIVTGATARCRTQGLYAETSWEPLHDRREFHRQTLMYRIINNQAPKYLIDLLPDLVRDRTGYNLRNQGDLDAPLARLNVYANSFFPRTINAWNDLSPEVTQAPSVEAFKAYHSRHLPQKNPLYYYGERYIAVIHARMRILNSPLKADLCNILHVEASPLCDCGLGQIEDAAHYFFRCPRFTTQRDELTADLLPHIIGEDQLNYLLFGIPDTDHPTNLHVFSAVHKYMKNTERFT